MRGVRLLCVDAAQQAVACWGAADGCGGTPFCRYHCNLNILLGKMRGSGGAIKWADVGALKAELEAQVGSVGLMCFEYTVGSCWRLLVLLCHGGA